MRSIGIDIHRDFMEVAVAEGGEIRSGPRVAMDPESLELFAASLDRTDQVALEVSGNAWEVVRILRPHVGRLVAASPTDTGMRQARAKTDRLDARALARLLASGQLETVWVPRRGDAGDAAAASAPKPARPHQIRGQERGPRGADEAARPEARLQRPVRQGRLELTAGARKGRGGAGVWKANAAARDAERKMAEQAEAAYRRTVAEFKRVEALRAKQRKEAEKAQAEQHEEGAGATSGRAS